MWLISWVAAGVTPRLVWGGRQGPAGMWLKASLDLLVAQLFGDQGRMGDPPQLRRWESPTTCPVLAHLSVLKSCGCLLLGSLS